MRQTTFTRTATVCALAIMTAGMMIAPLHAIEPQQQAPAAQPAAAEQADALMLYSSGLEGLLVSQKDQGLVAALRLIDDRLRELPREAPNFKVPPGVTQLVLDLLSSPFSLRAGMLEDAEPMNGPPIYAQFNFFTPDMEQAKALAGRFAGMLAAFAPAPSEPAPDLPGMQMMDVDGVPLYHGTQRIGDRSAFVIALNRFDDSPIQLDATDLPRGVAPALAFKLDFRQIQPAFEMMLQQAADADYARAQFEQMGIYGPNAVAISAALGYAADHALAAGRIANYRTVFERAGLRTAGPLTPQDLQRVPADATYARVSRIDFTSVGEAIGRSIQQTAARVGEIDEDADVMEMFRAQTGIHPQQDIFDHLGQVAGVYFSDAGGGGLLSLAGFIQVTNPEGLSQTIAHLSGMVNQFAQQQAKGYVRISERTFNGQSVTSLTFPGLPVPLELSFALIDGWLYAALSPQGLLAAIQQGRQADRGLLANPRFSQLAEGQMHDAFQVTFINTPRLLTSGYGAVTLGAAALANAVRSPADPKRDPGIVLPSLHELRDGASATLSVSRFVGDDLVVHMQLDQSVLVNVTGIVGATGGVYGLATPGMLVGLLLPAVAKARQSALSLKSTSQLMTLFHVVQVYAEEHDNELPPSLDALIEEGFITTELLQSPHGPAPDGGEDYFFHFQPGTFSSIQQPEKLVMGYDRSMLARMGRTAVIFYDGRTQQMSAGEFEILISQEPNKGIDFNLPW